MGSASKGNRGPGLVVEEHETIFPQGSSKWVISSAVLSLICLVAQNEILTPPAVRIVTYLHRGFTKEIHFHRTAMTLQVKLILRSMESPGQLAQAYQVSLPL
jgi:hypothetical protein